MRTLNPQPRSIARKGGGGGKGVAEDASILAIAYHNLAVEQEHLGHWEGTPFLRLYYSPA